MAPVSRRKGKQIFKPAQCPKWWGLSGEVLELVVTQNFFFLNVNRTRHGGLVVKVLALNMPGSHMGASSNPGSSTSHPAPCLWPRKAVKDVPKARDPAPMWETWRKFLALDQHSTGSCAYLWSESSDGRSSSLLRSVYLTSGFVIKNK